MHGQVAQQKSERVVARLLLVANRLSQALYNLHPASPQPARYVAPTSEHPIIDFCQMARNCWTFIRN